jgi:DNA (cytosine-5)-methyltransferase 1
MRPIGIDLFAGAGGLSLGFEQAGFDVAAAVEIDPIHCAVHEFNFPKTKTICGDVSKISGTDIRRAAGIGAEEIDVVFGGAPCQGFSMIGQRAMDDPRNGLVFHFVRLVRELKPKYFLFENVKGLTVGQHRQFLDEIVEEFGRTYNVLLPYRVLNAADYGVPQDRRRLFLTGARRGLALPEYPPPTGRTTIRDAIGDLPEVERFPELMSWDSVKVVSGTPSAYGRRMRELGGKLEHFAYRRHYDPHILTASMRAEHTALSRERFAATPCGQTEPVSRFHKLDPDGVCNTLRAGTNTDRGAFTSPRPIHFKTPRCITVREAARIHSYPDWFRFHVTKWHGFRQIGNSVPPLLARAVAGELLRAMGRKPHAPKEILELGDTKLVSFTMAEASAYYGVSRDVIAKRVRGAGRGGEREREAA